VTALGPRFASATAEATAGTLPLRLEPEATFGGLALGDGAAPLPEAVWYTAPDTGAGVTYRCPPGALAEARFLIADLLTDTIHLTAFRLELLEAGGDRVFRLAFAMLPQCSARMRMRMEAVDQNRWRFPREGAWLKPMAGGDRVDVGKVDRLRISVARKSEAPVRFCLTPVTAVVEEPERLKKLVLPRGKLLDELGQTRLTTWPGRSKDAEEVTARLKSQVAAAPGQAWPESFGRWGGWKERRFEATGFFRTTHDGTRSWLVDPDGQAFWSAGLDCVRVDTTACYEGLESALTWLPEKDGPYREVFSESRGQPHVNYLKVNFIRAFGPDAWHDKWATISLAELRRLGFNTVANWSEWEIARAAGFPYVRPMSARFEETPLVFRDFPDVYHPAFEEDAERFADTLRETRDDPALIGYFLMNEPTWGFARETPAAGLLFNSPRSRTRRALADFMRKRYASEATLADAWGAGTTFAALAEGEWKRRLTPKAEEDLAAFSEVIVERYFGTLSRACREADPNHLNLGIRYAGVPPEWAVPGMRSFDVFSMNCYRPRVLAEDMEKIYALLQQPIMIGEYHFGALDVGLPASGIGHVRTQEDRGKAFRIYTEDAAVKSWCVGVHYFTLYDQSAIGRFDGECYNIGFLDVCNRPHRPLCDAARASHERLYPVAAGRLEPFADEPEYLPLLYM
jgi:hypothetical protein